MTVEGWAKHSRYRQVFAIVRVDRSTGLDVDVEQGITVTKVVASAEEAAAEVERLNALREQAGGGSRYFWQLTRLMPSSEAATGRRSDRPDASLEYRRQ